MRFLIPLLAVLSVGAVHAKDLFEPHTRHVGSVKYDLKPLADWWYLDQKIRVTQIRPRQLQQWVKVTGDVRYRTNDWVLLEGSVETSPMQYTAKRQWITIRNAPDERRGIWIAYSTGVSVTRVIGQAQFSAMLFDYGKEKP